MNSETEQVKVYGADWCGMTTRTLDFLDELGVPYDYVDVEKDPHATEWVKQHADGKVKKPTLDIGGTVLVAPDNSELEEVLREHGLLAA
ncbi:MAG: glutaredoxin family protein [Bryobacteraceae bacterium]|nr:glutaredoxin family protein [Bryobacteraceae bacterium]